jgi:hypothetical protein
MDIWVVTENASQFTRVPRNNLFSFFQGPDPIPYSDPYPDTDPDSIADRVPVPVQVQIIIKQAPASAGALLCRLALIDKHY